MSDKTNEAVKGTVDHEKLARAVGSAEQPNSAHARHMDELLLEARFAAGSKLRQTLNAYIEAARTKEALERELKCAKEDCKSRWALVVSASYLQADLFEQGGGQLPHLSLGPPATYNVHETALEVLADHAAKGAWEEFARSLRLLETRSEREAVGELRGLDRTRVQGMCAALHGKLRDKNPCVKESYREAWQQGYDIIADLGSVGAWSTDGEVAE